MKRIFLLFCLLTLLIQPAIATGTEEDPGYVEEPLVSDVSSDPDDLSGYRTFSLTEPDLLASTLSGDDASVMADVIRNVLGEYQRMAYTVTVVDSDGTVIGTSTEYVPGLAGLDYCWLAGAAVFLVFFTGSFKLLGGLIR